MEQCIDKKIYNWMVDFRRDLHQHPELSWEEERTSLMIERELNMLGIYNRRMSGTGIVADLPGPEGVPRVALRADIDALPIFEETGLPFSSKKSGVMHACGHDGHASMLLAAAKVLNERKDLPAPVRFIFQPAEERGSGAKQLIEDGVLENVALIFGGHLDRHYTTGTLVVTPGPVNAAIDAFQVKISGSGGHAARPHETVDAVVVGSLMVMAFQTIVSREINPAQPAVVSVGRFNAGTTRNAIAGRAVLEGTIRTQDPEVRQHFEKAITRIVKSVGELHGAKVSVKFSFGPPLLENSPYATNLAREAAIKVVGQRNVREMALANLGAEDFSYYMEKIPGCYIRIGASFEDRQNFPAHSSKFDFNEEAMAHGAGWMCEMAHVAGMYLSKTEDSNVAVI